MISENEFFAIVKLLLCSLSGILIKYSLVFAKQKWINNFQHTITCVSLPVITFIITNVISNNIALSLGMVGALSIVRFRNPVKNTLEIVVYFALITIGIAAAVHLKYSLALTIFFCLAVIIIYLANLFFKSNFLFSTSYVEGDTGSFIEIEMKERSEDLEKDQGLVETFFNSMDKIYCYKIFYSDKTKADNIYKNYISHKDILNIKLYNE